MKIVGTLQRRKLIEFDDLRVLLDSEPLGESSTALPDEVTISIRKVLQDSEIQVGITVPRQIGTAASGGDELGFIIVGATTEACERARSFLTRRCRSVGIKVVERDL